MECLTCGVDTVNPKFCCRSCAAKHTNKIPKRVIKKKCTKCDNLVPTHLDSLCAVHFLERKNALIDWRKRTIADYTERESTKRQHASSKFMHIRALNRSWNKDMKKKPCYNCGYDKHVELCHIKPLSDFDPSTTLEEINNPTNIVQLCPNCHWEFDNGLLSITRSTENSVEYLKPKRGYTLCLMICPSCLAEFTRKKGQTYLTKNEVFNCCSPRCRGVFSQRIKKEGLTQEIKRLLDLNFVKEFNPLLE